MAGAQATVPQELDFFGLEKNSSDRLRPNFRGIQKAIAKMNPEIIKSVIASSGSRSGSVSQLFVPSLSGGCSQEEGGEETKPMTIFYNGVVTAFDLPKFQAERIMKMVKGESSKIDVVADPQTQPNLFEEGLPISKRKSLERFFEKRKERLMWASPYGIPKGPRAKRV